MIAALFVETGGIYSKLPNVDLWDEARDARNYAGPWRVIAHPPCDRWCQLAAVNRSRYGHAIGDDGGTFHAALNAVRKWGGVLEHPAFSLAWPAFNLPRPHLEGGWQRGFCGGWVAHIEQGRYGHRARKATWLYTFDIDPPIEMKWGSSVPTAWISTDRPRAEFIGIKQLGKREAKATPIEFRDALIAMVQS